VKQLPLRSPCISPEGTGTLLARLPRTLATAAGKDRLHAPALHVSRASVPRAASHAAQRLTPTPLPLVNRGGISCAVVGERARCLSEWPSSTNSRFALAWRNGIRARQPMIYSPVLGLPGSTRALQRIRASLSSARSEPSTVSPYHGRGSPETEHRRIDHRLGEPGFIAQRERKARVGRNSALERQRARFARPRAGDSTRLTSVSGVGVRALSSVTGCSGTDARDT